MCRDRVSQPVEESNSRPLVLKIDALSNHWSITNTKPRTGIKKIDKIHCQTYKAHLHVMENLFSMLLKYQNRDIFVYSSSTCKFPNDFFVQVQVGQSRDFFRGWISLWCSVAHYSIQRIRPRECNWYNIGTLNKKGSENSGLYSEQLNSSCIKRDK